MVLFPMGNKRSAASSASRLFLGMGGGGDITVVAADDEDVPVDRTATDDSFILKRWNKARCKIPSKRRRWEVFSFVEKYSVLNFNPFSLFSNSCKIFLVPNHS